MFVTNAFQLILIVNTDSIAASSLFESSYLWICNESKYALHILEVGKPVHAKTGATAHVNIEGRQCKRREA